MNVAAIVDLLVSLVSHHSSAGQPVPNQLADALAKAWAVYLSIGNLKHGLVAPNSLQNDINDLQQLLTALGAAGVLPTSGPLGDVQGLLNKFTNLRDEFDAGQAVSIFAFSADGKKAHAYAAVDGGPGAAALGG